jgi:hypothetical protein
LNIRAESEFIQLQACNNIRIWTFLLQYINELNSRRIQPKSHTQVLQSFILPLKLLSVNIVCLEQSFMLKSYTILTVISPYFHFTRSTLDLNTFLLARVQVLLSFILGRHGNRVKIYRIYPSKDRLGATWLTLRRLGIIIRIDSINQYYYTCTIRII